MRQDLEQRLVAAKPRDLVHNHLVSILNVLLCIVERPKGVHVRNGITLHLGVGGSLLQDPDQSTVVLVAADGVNDRERKLALRKVLRKRLVLMVFFRSAGEVSETWPLPWPLRVGPLAVCVQMYRIGTRT